jgi:hypothetical protein
MADKIDELRTTLEQLRVQLAVMEVRHQVAQDTPCVPPRIHELCETFARQMRELMGKAESKLR